MDEWMERKMDKIMKEGRKDGWKKGEWVKGFMYGQEGE